MAVLLHPLVALPHPLEVLQAQVAALLHLLVALPRPLVAPHAHPVTSRRWMRRRKSMT